MAWPFSSVRRQPIISVEHRPLPPAKSGVREKGTMMLSVKKVAAAIKSGRGRYHDGFGLNLVVRTVNNASWQLRYQIAGRERWLGLGPAHLVTIGEARVRARRARLMLLDGLDPIEEKKRQRAATALSSARVVTFSEAVRGYFAVHQSRWRKQKSRNNFLASLETFAYPVLGNLAVPRNAE
jgi:hypothetical protein